MLIFGAEGRLGNQLFQYAFLKTIRKRSEKIIVFGFDDLKLLFNIEDITNISNKNRFLKKFTRRVAKPVLHLLARYRIISSVQVERIVAVDGYLKESTEYNQIIGIIKSITFIYDGTFHSEKFFNPLAIENLTLKSIYIDEAKKSLTSVPCNAHKIFVHIRRGDYKEYKVYGKSSLLPCHYFENQIEWFENNIPNSYFIFLSDEPHYIQANFSHISNKLIIEGNSMGGDFAIMTLCNSGILSPSSFGWWGSYMMYDRSIVIAPKYWLGFNSLTEYPSSPYPNFIKLAEST